MDKLMRKYAIVEPVSVFLLIMAYIWELRFSHQRFWLVILVLILLSHRLHRERAETLGFQAKNLRHCVEVFAPALVLIGLLLLGCGVLLETTRPIAFDDGLIALMGYIPWGLFQQYVLNGYFFNRLERAVSHKTAPVFAAALFSSAHLPNWFLMTVTLLSGYICVLVYRRYRNLYFLGLAHALFGFLLYLVVPDSISHHLKIGPGWFRH